MKQKYRDGRIIEQENRQDQLLARLYGSRMGRMFLRPLVAPWVSRIAGRFLSSRLSVGLIQPFIRSNHIDLAQFENVTYRSYNEFFSRRIRPELRPVDPAPDHLIAPCDSKLTVLPITPDGRLMIKHTPYTVVSLLGGNAELAARYVNGQALIFRLTVDDYHRYCYIADGSKTENVQIPGVLHTVNPIANDYYPIYKENTREYSILSCASFGDVLMMEVGALMVGKIVNHHGAADVCRGQEKGYFQFGGSTVVLLLQESAAVMDNDILQNSLEGIETVVRMGEKIGRAFAKSA